MKCDLTLKERMYLLQTLPGSGDYKTVCLQRSIADKILATHEEDQYIRKAQGGFAIDPKVDKETKEFEFTDGEIGIITPELIRMEKSGQLNMGNISIYEKFINDQAEELDIDVELEEESQQKDD